MSPLTWRDSPDTSTPVSAANLNLLEQVANKGQWGGYAGLDPSGRVPLAQVAGEIASASCKLGALAVGASYSEIAGLQIPIPAGVGDYEVMGDILGQVSNTAAGTVILNLSLVDELGKVLDTDIFRFPFTASATSLRKLHVRAQLPNPATPKAISMQASFSFTAGTGGAAFFTGTGDTTVADAAGPGLLTAKAL